MGVELYANNPSTTVSSGGTTAPAQGTQESWTVAASTAFPAASNTAQPQTQFHVADPSRPSELIKVINVSGTTWTVIRGAESTAPVAHSSGFAVTQVVTAGQLANLTDADILGTCSPAIASSESFPRVFATTNQGSVTSGDLYVTSIPLATDMVVNNITAFTGTTAGSGITDGWYVLADSNRIVRAVTADTPSAFVAANTEYTLATTAAYTATYTGQYYIGFMIAAATTPSFWSAPSMGTGIYNVAPIYCGIAGTGLTTPPAVGSTLATITGTGSHNTYFFVS